MTSQEESDLPVELGVQVKSLVKQGEHVRAAELLSGAGHHARAAALYDSIFERERALAEYEACGDLVSAVRVALDLGDGARLDGLVAAAVSRGLGDALVAVLGRTGREAEIARIHLARGDLMAAASSFERAGALDRAAQCLDECGRSRDAGLLLERHLSAVPQDAESAWRLGRLLVRFGRHDDGIAWLQRAIRAALDPDHMVCRVAAAMAVSFTHLGYEHAARSVFARWQTAAGRLTARIPQPLHVVDDEMAVPPESFEAFMRSERATALAAVQGSVMRTAGPADGTGFGASVHGAGDADPSTAPSSVDELLLAGRYLLGEPLGGGGVGQVFRAYDACADRPVAVKIFGADVLSSQVVSAFARDARAFAALRHPAVASLIELNMAYGFVVTEFISVGTVEERIQRGGDAGWVLAAAHAVLDLLANAHRVGLVHGGLKPTNIFLEPGGARVVDVGAHHLLALRSTETGGLSSIWPYLAPEQLFGAPASTAGDLYAVAAILFRAFTGRPPFVRIDDDRRQAPPLASSIHPSVPTRWDAFFSQALHPVVEQRFHDATAMAAALPSLSHQHQLPTGVLIDASRRLAVPPAKTVARYTHDRLVSTEAGGAVRFYEGMDRLLGRPVWIVEAEDSAMLQPLVACARLWRGVQPVYDVLPDVARVVVARDERLCVADLAVLRAVPQGLSRDLSGLAFALETLHAQGWCLNGFPLTRALGPIGPRFTIAPAPLFETSSSEGVTADWNAFGSFVASAFGLDSDGTDNLRARLVAALVERRGLPRGDAAQLLADAAHLSWRAFLERLTQRLVIGASSGVVARLVASVVRG